MSHLNRPLRRALTAAMLALAALAIGAVFGTARTGNAASQAAPSNVTPPTINGGNEVGKTLKANPGQWNGTKPITFRYQWQRCDKTGASCAGISGANAQLYDVQPQDEGNTLRVRVTARNTSGSSSSTSAPTAVIVAAPPAPPATGCPAGTGAVAASQLAPPARLVIDNFQSTPSVIGAHPGNISLRVHVSACNGRSVGGALVYGAAIPYNQFTTPEVPTASDGWATLNMQQLAGYPVSSRQGLLAIFLRARRTGENILTGVSNRRLVSLDVNLSQ